MGWERYQTVNPQKRAKGWWGTVWCPSTNSALQISIFQIYQIFNSSYFPQFNLSFEKKISFQKCPKTTQKFTQNRLTVLNKISIEIQRCLKRDRDIGRKAKVMLSDLKTAFTCTPALIKDVRAQKFPRTDFSKTFTAARK